HGRAQGAGPVDLCRLGARPPHPPLRGDLSPEGRGGGFGMLDAIVLGTSTTPNVPSPLWGEGQGEGSDAGESTDHLCYFTLGKLNSAPPLMPAGQRVVTVLSRV